MKANLRVDEVAEILNCSTRHVYDLIGAGHFICFRIGKRSVRITAASVKAYQTRQIALYALENPPLEETAQGAQGDERLPCQTSHSCGEVKKMR
jgi:excisionase family DNA binding protein